MIFFAHGDTQDDNPLDSHLRGLQIPLQVLSDTDLVKSDWTGL